MQPYLRIIFSSRKGASNIYKALKPPKSATRGIETLRKRLNININENEIFIKLKKTLQMLCCDGSNTEYYVMFPPQIKWSPNMIMNKI